MGRADWRLMGAPNKTERSNVMITVADSAAVAEGETVTAVCNSKTFTATIKNGIAKLYTSEVGTYTITAGEYSTMLVCPYFGVFSTDIYSGVLKVTCTEAGGNNKTCHVQSCDDSYNITDSYNLTQTFDSNLVLTFLGIPAGRYLVTVDDKYRFFKEIISIQNINETEVELKQWLYNGGDNCEWNTGGWMKCYQNAKTMSEYTKFHANVKATAASQSADFLATMIQFSQTCTAQSAKGYEKVNSRYYDHFLRGEVGAYTYIGTKKALPITLNKYRGLSIINTGSPLTICVRSGATNDVSTTTSTATVLVAGISSALDLNANADTYHVVVGKEYYAAEINISTDPGNVNYSFSSAVTGIYLT